MDNSLREGFRKKRCFGFVVMISESSEKTAIDDLQDVEWLGREIRVNKAAQKDRTRRNNRYYGSKKIFKQFLYSFKFLRTFVKK